MKLEFEKKGNWILPTEGTLGNKAKNLLDNATAIKACQLKIPRSLVIPYEYLQAVDKPAKFTLEQIDRYFPEWLRVAVRSNAPDEDLIRRNPGQYVSEDLWHEDRDYALALIDKVMDSYNGRIPRMLRIHQGLEEKAMCLLIQDIVSDTPGDYDAVSVGCFSDIGELALLTVSDPDYGLETMTKEPVRTYKVDKNGSILGPHESSEELPAKRLRKLADSLPKTEGKGWEIEYVGIKGGIYVVQTTPIEKHKKIDFSNTEDNLLNCVGVLGINEISAEGILYVVSAPDMEMLSRFDASHKNYCLATVHPNLQIGSDFLHHFSNAAVVVDVTVGFWIKRPFAPHVRQWMREGRVALAGTFSSKYNLNHILTSDTSGLRSMGEKLRYSPIKLRVKADELLGKGTIELEGEMKPFVPLDIYLESLEK